jgi:glycine dehydrogenase subunit 2
MKPTVLDSSRINVSGHQIFDPDFGQEVPLVKIKGARNQEMRLGLPERTEIEIIRHYTNLTHNAFGVDNGTYPLGSCTMKYNPKRNDKLSQLAGFQKAHPSQPEKTLNGLWQFMYEMQIYLAELLGMDAFSLQPAAGAHGELAGIYMIRKFFEVEKKEQRNIILVADSAHGTNPASASMAGFECKMIQTDKQGLMDIEALKNALDANVAALMLTNPSTLGLFEKNIVEIAELIHRNGSLLYYDGANLNAIMGITRPGDMGFDIVHLNTHKTLSTPHSGGGPGAGPVGVKQFLRSYLPVPIADKNGNIYFPNYKLPHTIGRMKANYGHIDVLLKAYCYILTNGAQGLKEATENAVLNANYLQTKLKDILPPVFNKLCMHECLLNGDVLKISAYSFVKRLIDYGVHPPTLVGAGCVYFSDDLGSAILMEPTETETKETLDELVSIFRKIWNEVKENPDYVKNAPHSKNVSQIPLMSQEII